LKIRKSLRGEQPAAQLLVEIGADRRAGDGAAAAEHDDHHRLGRQAQIERVRRLDERALEEIKAAGERRQERGEAVGERLVQRRRHTEHHGGVFVLADRNQAEPELRRLDRIAEIEREPHHRDQQEINHPQRPHRPAKRLEYLRREIEAGGTAPRFEIGDEGLDALVDADGRERKKGAAQAQDAKAEDERQKAHGDTGGKLRRRQRPGMRADQIHADIAAEAEEDDAAEIDVSGIAEHDVEIAGERNVDGGEQQALAQLHVVADERHDGKGGDGERDDPEKGAIEHRARPIAVDRAGLLAFHERVKAKTPRGKMISTRTKRTNSMTSVQLTGMNCAAKPSTRPRATPPTSAPAGLPSPPSAVTTKLLS
jgi:hypothetical protein